MQRRLITTTFKKLYSSTTRPDFYGPGSTLVREPTDSIYPKVPSYKRVIKFEDVNKTYHDALDLVKKKDFDYAATTLRCNLIDCHLLDNVEMTANFYSLLGDVEKSRKEYVAACYNYGNAWRLVQQLENNHEVKCYLLFNLIKSFEEEQNYEAANDYLLEFKDLVQRYTISDDLYLEIILSLGKNYLRLGRKEDAKPCFEEAINKTKLSSQLSNNFILGHSYYNLGELTNEVQLFLTANEHFSKCEFSNKNNELTRFFINEYIQNSRYVIDYYLRNNEHIHAEELLDGVIASLDMVKNEEYLFTMAEFYSMKAELVDNTRESKINLLINSIECLEKINLNLIDSNGILEQIEKFRDSKYTQLFELISVDSSELNEKTLQIILDYLKGHMIPLEIKDADSYYQLVHKQIKTLLPIFSKVDIFKIFIQHLLRVMENYNVSNKTKEAFLL